MQTQRCCCWMSPPAASTRQRVRRSWRRCRLWRGRASRSRPCCTSRPTRSLTATSTTCCCWAGGGAQRFMGRPARRRPTLRAWGTCSRRAPTLQTRCWTLWSAAWRAAQAAPSRSSSRRDITPPSLLFAWRYPLLTVARTCVAQDASPHSQFQAWEQHCGRGGGLVVDGADAPPATTPLLARQEVLGDVGECERCLRSTCLPLLRGQGA